MNFYLAGWDVALITSRMITLKQGVCYPRKHMHKRPNMLRICWNKFWSYQLWTCEKQFCTVELKISPISSLTWNCMGLRPKWVPFSMAPYLHAMIDCRQAYSAGHVLESRMKIRRIQVRTAWGEDQLWWTQTSFEKTTLTTVAQKQAISKNILLRDQPSK